MKPAAARNVELAGAAPIGADVDAIVELAPSGTLAFYEEHALGYSSSTSGLDMVPELARFALGLETGAAVLDVGCGGGRDLASLSAAGFAAIGLDISPRLAAIAQDRSACQVMVGDMRNPPFDDGSFDGIWAAASLLHLRRREVVPTLQRLLRLLTSGGRLFASVKAGQGEQTTADGRSFTYYQLAEWEALLVRSGFDAVEVEPDSEDPSWIQSFARAP